MNFTKPSRMLQKIKTVAFSLFIFIGGSNFVYMLFTHKASNMTPEAGARAETEIEILCRFIEAQGGKCGTRNKILKNYWTISSDFTLQGNLETNEFASIAAQAGWGHASPPKKKGIFCKEGSKLTVEMNEEKRHISISNDANSPCQKK
jgi:hypothetical protein